MRLLFLLLLSLASLLALSSAQQCGSQADYNTCPNNLCCSQFGYCGSTSEYCCAGCQSQCSCASLLSLSPLHTLSSAEQCGSQAGYSECPNNLCCSQYGYCGSTSEYCCAGCQSQCSCASLLSQSLATPSPLPNPNGVIQVINSSIFEEFLPYRNDPRCPAAGFYTFKAFVTAADTFPEFGTTGDMETRKREIAAFFGQTSQETTGGWPGAPGGQYAWGYCFKEKVSGGDYCVPSNEWPCVLGQKYHGQGPLQLSYNYNYGPAGQALGLDLLANPKLVAQDAVISFKTALWFWMTPQPPKPSCHDVIVGNWEPTQADVQANQLPGYGLITNIINGGIECGHGPNDRAEERIKFFKRYCDMYGISYGENLNCNNQKPFGWGLVAKAGRKLSKATV